MRMGLGRIGARLSALAATLLWLSACGGGGSTGGSTPVVPGGPAKATSALTVSGTIKGTGPYVSSGKRRVAGTRGTSSAPTFAHIDVTGTLYAADASATPITNTVTIPPPAGGVYTASVGFSNVTNGNNEWALLEFTGVAADGSKIALGEVGGLVNVGGTNPTTAALDATTTQTLQLFITLLSGGLISTYDIDSVPSLSNTLASQITNAGVTPDPATGVFTAGAMQQLYTVVGPLYQRIVTISTNPSTPGNFQIIRDYTNASELNLEASLDKFLNDIGIPSVLTSNAGSFLLRTSGVLGYDIMCGGFALGSGNLRLAPGQAIVPTDVFACSVPNPTGTEQVRNVYGGNVMIGATNDPYDPNNPNSFMQPFLGGWTSVPPRPAGRTPAPVTVTIASTEFPVVVNDPYEAAFPTMTAPYGAFPTFGTGALSATNFHQAPAYSPNTYRVVEGGFSGTQETVTVDTFNPWNVSSANLSLCSVPFQYGVAIVLPACFPLSTAQPITLTRTFGDDGTNLSYYNWAVGGAGGSIAPDPTNGYDVAPNAGTITLSTTTPTALYGRSQLAIFNDLSVGTVWTATVTTSPNHQTHTNHGTNVLDCGCGKIVAVIELDDLANTQAIENITLSADPLGGNFVFGPIYADPIGTSIGGNYLSRKQAGHRVVQAVKRR
jgi:hypothetical protein